MSSSEPDTTCIIIKIHTKTSVILNFFTSISDGGTQKALNRYL